MARIQSVDDKAFFTFVGDENAHHSEWLESISPTDRHRRDALDFCKLSGCEQLVRWPTHSAGNRLDLVMTDVPDIVDVFVGTPLVTSDHTGNICDDRWYVISTGHIYDDGCLWHSRCIRWYSTYNIWSTSNNLYRSKISEVLSFWSIIQTRTIFVVQSGALLGATFWSQLIQKS